LLIGVGAFLIFSSKKVKLKNYTEAEVI